MFSSNRRTPAPPALSFQLFYDAAIRYLQRFSSSSEHLRQILHDKARRWLPSPDPDTASQINAWIDEVLLRLQDARYLNDRDYARLQAESLHQRGSSTLAIRGKLAQKGLPSALIQEALDSLQAFHQPDEDDPSTDLLAACILARKKKLGPFRRSPEDREARRDRDLAALQRAGFSFKIARLVVDASDIDELPSSRSW